MAAPDPVLARVAALLGTNGEALLQSALQPPGAQAIEPSWLSQMRLFCNLGVVLQERGLLSSVLDDLPAPLSPERNTALADALREAAARCSSSERKRKATEQADDEAGPDGMRPPAPAPFQP